MNGFTPRRSALVGAGTMLLALLAGTVTPAAYAQPAQPVLSAPSQMRLDIDQMDPRVVTADTPEVTFTGKVTNIGDRRIDDVRIQLRRGERLDSDTRVRAFSKEATEAARSPFVKVSDALEPGSSAPISFSVAIHKGIGSLHIDQPGVYPLLVNVNGRPQYGGQARLAAISVLLPVLAVPAGPAAVATSPTRITVLWPLVDDHPRLVPTLEGTTLLSDDELASSLSPGGRLHALLNATAQAAAANSAVLNALCFAVDPDLLRTVKQMTAGYRVPGPDGQTVDGKGAEAAKTWLARLRELTSGRCVITLPYADADLMALSRAGAVDLERVALGGTSIVQEILKPVQPLSGVVWPADGTLDQRTMTDLSGTGPTTVLVNPANLQHAEGSSPFLVKEATSAGSVRAIPIDWTVSTLLANPRVHLPVASGPILAQLDNRPIPAQNGLAAVVFRAALDGQNDDPILIAPPRRWAAPPAELSAFVQSLNYLFAAGFGQAAPLANTVSTAAGGTAGGLTYTAQEGAAEVSTSVTAEIMRVNAAQRDLLGAMDVDDTAQVSPSSLLEPVQYGLLRASSTAWRGHLDLAGQAVARAGAHLDTLRGQVTVNNPGRPLTLASGTSPIPVLLRNTMPVSVLVRIKLAETPGLRHEPIPDVVVPANGAVNHYLQAEVVRAGRFTLDVSLSTPGGTRLGSTARLELTSTSYGAVTLIITGTAAAALVVLAGLRIARRIRTARMTPATEGHPIQDSVNEDT